MTRQNGGKIVCMIRSSALWDIDKTLPDLNQSMKMGTKDENEAKI